MSGGVVLVKRKASEVDKAPAGKVRIFVDESGRLSAKDESGAVVTPQALIASLEAVVATKQDAASAATDSELASAVATLMTAISAKQDASTAATDTELAAAVASLNTAVSLKQDASSAATDSELANETTAREAADSTLIPLAQKGAANGVATLDGSGKLPATQLTVDALEYKGVWDAAANSPALVDGTGSPGDQFKVSVGGSHDFGSGVISFAVGDYAIYNGARWEKVDTTDQVTSVAGKQGAVTLASTDISGLGSAATKDSGTAGEAGKVIATDDPTVAHGAPTLGSVLVADGVAWVLVTAAEAGMKLTSADGGHPVWARTGHFPLEAWKGLVSGEDWTPALEAAIAYAKAKGGGVVVPPEGETKLSVFPEMPASGTALEAVHFVGPGKHSCRVKITKDAGAGHFAIKWAGTTETETAYCHSRIEGFVLEGGSSLGSAYAMDGVMGARHNYFADFEVRGFHSGWFPYADHIIWGPGCEAHANAYGVYYGKGPTNIGNHEMFGINLSNNGASFGVSQEKNINGIINRPAPTTLYGGHVGDECEYGVLIEKSTTKAQALVWQMACFGTSWEKPSVAFMDEIPDSDGNRWGCVGGGQGFKIHGGTVTSDNAQLGAGFRAGAFSHVLVDCPLAVAETSGKTPALFSAKLCEGVLIGPGVSQYRTIAELYSHKWRLFDGHCVGCRVLTGSAEYQVVNVSGTPIAGQFVTYIPDSTGPLGFPGESRTVLMAQRAASRTTAKQPILGLLRSLDSAEATVSTALVMTRGNATATNFPLVVKVNPEEEIPNEAPLFLAPNGTVGLNEFLGPLVGYATEASAKGALGVAMQFDLATVVKTVPAEQRSKRFTANGEYVVPTVTPGQKTLVRVTCVGGGGGGAGGGAAAKTGGVTKQVGGGGGGAGATSSQVLEVEPGTVLTVTIGTGGTAGAGGAASTNAEGHAGGVGSSFGNDTKVTGGPSTVIGKGGRAGSAGGANSESTVGGGSVGGGTGSTSTGLVVTTGIGGAAQNASGSPGGGPGGEGGGGGCGGAPASTTNGGSGGKAGSLGEGTVSSTEKTGTKEGGEGESAAANSGAGGGGGGGGAPEGAGGKGGAGGSGKATIELLS